MRGPFDVLCCMKRDGPLPPPPRVRDWDLGDPASVALGICVR
jgi:hypothetical protein